MAIRVMYGQIELIELIIVIKVMIEKRKNKNIIQEERSERGSDQLL